MSSEVADIKSDAPAEENNKVNRVKLPEKKSEKRM